MRSLVQFFLDLALLPRIWRDLVQQQRDGAEWERKLAAYAPTHARFVQQQRFREEERARAPR